MCRVGHSCQRGTATGIGAGTGTGTTCTCMSPPRVGTTTHPGVARRAIAKANNLNHFHIVKRYFFISADQQNDDYNEKQEADGATANDKGTAENG
jgi:hypothetical protein